MILLARLCSRLVGIALLALIAVVAALAAVFCIEGGHGTLSLARLAAHLHLPALRGDVHDFLMRVTASGSVAVVALLCGIGAVLVGLLLLCGLWVRPRPRRVVLGHTELGALEGLRRPLRQTLAEQTLQAPEIGRAHAQVKASKRADGGRARVRVRAAVGVDREAARAAARTAVGPIVEPLPLRMRVRARGATRRQRKLVQA